MTMRELADAETRLLVALHFNPLIREQHFCNLDYLNAVQYGVELASCDEVFLSKQTLDYVLILSDVRKLFE
jgi:hypothetical protein